MRALHYFLHEVITQHKLVTRCINTMTTECTDNVTWLKKIIIQHVLDEIDLNI